MGETITFELIRKVHREEMRSTKLTKLPENFYENVLKYLEKKREMAEKLDDRKIAIEVRNVKRLIEEIFNRRERKIVTLAINCARVEMPVENLTEEEREFFEKIRKVIKDRRDSFLKKLEEGKKKTAFLVVFKQDVPEFVGIDMKTYGPFSKGDIAKIPEENANMLIEQGLAEKFEVDVS